MSGLYPLTCLTWVALPGDKSPASIAVRVIETQAPQPRQGCTPRGGHVCNAIAKPTVQVRKGPCVVYPCDTSAMQLEKLLHSCALRSSCCVPFRPTSSDSGEPTWHLSVKAILLCTLRPICSDSGEPTWHLSVKVILLCTLRPICSDSGEPTTQLSDTPELGLLTLQGGWNSTDSRGATCTLQQSSKLLALLSEQTTKN